MLEKIEEKRRPGFVTESLIKSHEALLFLRAYPPDRGALERAEALLASIPERVAAIQEAGGDLSPFEESDVSGIAGTSFSAIFSYEVTRRLAELEGDRLRIDWDRYDASSRLAGAWRRLFPLVEEDTM